MERHQDIVTGLHRAAPALFHNAECLNFGSIDLLTHTTCGVQNKAQARGWGDVQQPGKEINGLYFGSEPLVS